MMLRYLISNIEKCVAVMELTKQIFVLNAINLIKKSWNYTNALTVANCFCEAGFPTGTIVANDVTLDDDPEDDIPLIHLQLFRRNNWKVRHHRRLGKTILDNINGKEILYGTSKKYESD